MRRLLATSLLLALSGCGAAKEAEEKALTDNTITLEPLPGTYSFKPIVIMRKKDNGVGSGSAKLKLPGASEFTDANSCLLSPYDTAKVSVAEYCVEIEKSGTLAYRLETTSAKGKEQSAEYKVELATTPITISSPATIELKEVETHCSYSPSGDLEVVMQLTQEQKLPTGYQAFLGWTIKVPAAGKSVTINQDNTDVSVSMVIKPVSDGVPSRTSLSDNYTTSGSSSNRNASCTITVDKAERVRETKGTLTCTGLGSFLNESDPTKIPFGKTINLGGSWQCDRFRS